MLACLLVFFVCLFVCLFVLPHKLCLEDQCRGRWMQPDILGTKFNLQPPGPIQLACFVMVLVAEKGSMLLIAGAAGFKERINPRKVWAASGVVVRRAREDERV